MNKMKKLITYILLVTFAVSLTTIPVIAEEDNLISIEEISTETDIKESIMDQDFSSGALGSNWVLNQAVRKNDALVLAEGASVSNGSVTATAKYTFNMIEEDKVIALEYDIKPGKDVTTIAQISGKNGFVIPATFDTSKEICINSYDTSVEKARTYTNYISGKWYHVSAVIDQVGKRLRTIITDKETGEVVAQKQVFKYKPFDSATYAMESGINVLTFQVNMGNNKTYTPSTIDNVKVGFIPVGYNVYTEAFGNNFGRTDKEEVCYKIKNISDTPYECEIEWKVDALELGLMKEGVEKISLAPHEEKDIVVEVDIQRYGLYKITSNVFYYDGENKRDIGNSSEMYFSKVLTSDGESYSSRLGFASHSDTGSYEEIMKLMERIGCTGTRGSLASWNPVQNGTTRAFNYDFNTPAFESWKNSKMDSNVYFLAYGHKTLVNQVDFTGKPATPDYFRPPVTDEEIELYGDYVDYTMDRLEGKVKYYEVWNEFSGSVLSNVYGGELLAKICKEVQERVKKRDPEAQVIGLGGVMIRDTEFTREFFEAGGADYCDGFSIHPYNSDGGAIYPKESWMQLTQGIIDIIREYAPDKPIYFTEQGWSSAWDNTTEEIKGRAIVKTNVAMLAHNMADKIYVHQIDNNGLKPTDREHQFGVLTATGDYRGDKTALAGFVMTAAMNKLLPGDIKSEGMIEKEDRLISAHNIKREDGTNVAVMWAGTLRNVDFSIDLGCKTVEAYDEFGNLIDTIHSENGIFNFGISDKLMYVVGKFTKFEEVSTTITHKESLYLSTLNDMVYVKIVDDQKRNGRIEVEYNKEVTTPVSELVMKDGVAELYFKTSSERMGEFPLNIKVYDENENCFYAAQNVITITDPITASVKPVNYFNNDSRWGIEITIHNNANLVPAQGVARITGPSDIAGKTVTVPFSSIAPQSEESVYINLPEMLKKRTITVKGEVELDYGYKIDYSQYLDFTAAYYAHEKPTIDGIIEEGEWSGVAMAATDAANWTTLISGTKWLGPQDNSLNSMNIMWDEEKFYLAAVVKDDIIMKTPLSLESANVSESADPAFYLWQYDSIQFGIEDEYFNVPNRLTYPFTEFGLALGDKGPYCYRFSGQTQLDVAVVENCEVAVTVLDGEILYEFAVPWSEIKGDGYKPDESLIYSFAALVNDNDGVGRKGYIMYNDGIGNGKKVELFGQMTLKR